MLDSNERVDYWTVSVVVRYCRILRNFRHRMFGNLVKEMQEKCLGTKKYERGGIKRLKKNVSLHSVYDQKSAKINAN